MEHVISNPNSPVATVTALQQLMLPPLQLTVYFLYYMNKLVASKYANETHDKDELAESPANSYPTSYDHGGSSGPVNPLSVLVAPLAALALLGAAAAVASNPVLLTLAVLNGKRKRRDLEQIGSDHLTPEIESKLKEIEVYLAQ